MRRRRRIPRRPDLWPRAWRRHPLGALLALVIAGVVLWSRLHTPIGSDEDRYHNKLFTCVKVVDGDTIDIAIPDGDHPHTRIRLWGVDTPETVKPGEPPMYFGHEASAYTRSRVLGHPVRIVLSPGQSRDKYERLLAYVYPDDGENMLNEELLAGGYAYADSRFAHPWKERFIELEKRARRQKVGLWAGVTVQQMPEWRQRLERWKSEQRK